MSQDQVLPGSERRPKNQPPLTGAIPWRAALTVILLSLFTVQPVTAQNSVVCNADNLPSMIGGFLRLITALGTVGLAIIWQTDLLIEMLTSNLEQKKGLRRHKRSTVGSAVVPAVLGPLYMVAGAMTELPLAEFVNLVPW